MTNHCPSSGKLSSIPDKSIEQIEVTYRVIKDIAYGLDNDQTMDMYISADAKNLGGENFTVVFLHGGAFYLSDKSLEEKYIQPYLSKGMHVVNVNYRLKQGIPKATEDLAIALNFLEATNAKNTLNLSNVILAGFSAGAHIASTVGLSVNHPESPYKLNEGIRIAGIINFSGLVDGLDLVERRFMDHGDQWMKDIGEALFPLSHGYTPKEIISRYEPITYFDQDDPPFFLWYGGKDDQIPPSTFEQFVQLLYENKEKNVVMYSPESSHFPNATERKDIYNRIFDFLDKLGQATS
ncbi:alpha/beta hydrolase [Rufibacter immobilis]|uniref:Alpha/beta hydrolase n=1 Tax=Rufibacter immobilis TaxID=1348778 RepID=A0A3M9MVQ3_9BACT|nr:alpha/beta hydrolase [Rufibacter immobilis]RNI29622.1 alpha/beta hydrolase [Rufibacter immobilis]